MLDHALLGLHLADLVDRVGPDAVDALADDADLGLETLVQVLRQLGPFGLELFEHVREVVESDLAHVVEHVDGDEVAFVDGRDFILVDLYVGQLEAVLVVPEDLVAESEENREQRPA